MTKKRYTIENLDCANCAAKIEEKLNTLSGVEATVSFATRTLVVTAEKPDALLPAMQKIVRSVEPDGRIVPHVRTLDKRDEHDHEHHHHHEDATAGGHRPLIVGAALMILGILLDRIGAELFGFHVSNIAYLMAYLLLGASVLIAAYKGIRVGHVLDENFLMSIATIGAIVIGQFPEAVGVMLFYRVGEYFEERAVARSRKEITRTASLRPETVLLEDGREIPAADVKVGDLLLIRPGDRIGLDGEIISGSGRIDTAALTGEPVPVTVKPGDRVLSGCVNLNATLILKVDTPLEESTVSRILRAMETAAEGKPQLDRFITRFSKIYTPIVVLAAIAVAVIPSLVTGDWGHWVYTALSFLVMSCPCALVLSVPLTFFSGIGAGSKKGILFKDGAAVEALATVKAVALDKTGTITKGEFEVQPCDPAVLRLIAACEQYSTHPIAQSIVAAAQRRNMTLEKPEQVEELPGLGIRASLAGKTVLCGNEKLLTEAGVEAPQIDEPGVVVHVAADGQYLGHLLVADTLRPGVQRAVASIQKLGLKTVMLTGDRLENAQAVADSVGIENVHARLLPQDKLELMQTLRQETGAVMFVGDGINDSPVLAGADVGAAMGSGADAAIEAADVVFMTASPNAIPTAVELARKTRAIALQNVIFALAIKALVILLGFMGIASMWLAVFADSGVAMLCVLNSIRLLYSRK